MKNIHSKIFLIPITWHTKVHSVLVLAIFYIIFRRLLKHCALWCLLAYVAFAPKVVGKKQTTSTETPHLAATRSN